MIDLLSATVGSLINLFCHLPDYRKENLRFMNESGYGPVLRSFRRAGCNDEWPLISGSCGSFRLECVTQSKSWAALFLTLLAPYIILSVLESSET